MDLSYETVSNQGERVLEGDRAGLVHEHESRYRFASRYLSPSRLVLDCACGSGYGAAILAEQAERVIGIDISPVAIEYARSRYLQRNINFQLGSAEELPVATDSVDVFCSFETIEHIPHPDRLVAEAQRVLHKSGYFLVSTPNRIVSGLESGERPSNPFHLREWSLKEFHDVLSRWFTQIEYFGQRIKSNNKFHPLYLTSKWKRFTKDIDIVSLGNNPQLRRQLEDPQSWQPIIFIAVCRKT
jgi:ubiquinone/menaquinone biosynthesis C-methylase UbiE